MEQEVKVAPFDLVSKQSMVEKPPTAGMPSPGIQRVGRRSANIEIENIYRRLVEHRKRLLLNVGNSNMDAKSRAWLAVHGKSSEGELRSVAVGIYQRKREKEAKEQSFGRLG